MTMPLLDVRHLTTRFSTRQGEVCSVDDVSLTIDEGEAVSLVGESGCGKSVTALSILRLVASPGRIVGGQVFFAGRDLLGLTANEMREVRGNDIAMIFQDPMTSLNPVMTVGAQIAEAIRRHRRVSRREAAAQAIEGLREVAIPSPEMRARQYPHEMSGGMRQRVMIAMALACDPRLLIADEPTTALDVTIQAQILELLAGLRRRRNLALLLITHDLGVVAETVDRVAVMYSGRIVEEAPVREIFAAPRHPYTEGLLRAAPRLTPVGADDGRPTGALFGPESAHVRGKRLETIEGQVPNPHNLPPGCHFAPRCGHARSLCNEGRIEPVRLTDLHLSLCRRTGEIYS